MWLVSAWPVGGNLPFELIPGEFTIGRSKQHPIVIYDSSISRIHARVRVAPQGGEISIEDLGSRNGIDVNGKLTKFGCLKLNDRLRLGAVPCLITTQKDIKWHALDDSTTSDGAPSDIQTLRIDLKLSSPQVEVLELIARGLTEDEVAAKTGRSYHTVHNHVRTLYKLFGVRSRNQLIRRVKPGAQM